MTDPSLLVPPLGRERIWVRQPRPAVGRLVSPFRPSRCAAGRPPEPLIEVQIVVIAKHPVPGRVKTRLCPPCNAEQAAKIAAAALADTLDVVTATPAFRRTLLIEGDHRPPAGWRTVAQQGAGLAERLFRGYVDTALARASTFLLGMDPPALLLPRRARPGSRGFDAVLGLPVDGGWWGLGLRDPADARVLDGVPMSTPRTGADTLAALQNRGLTVARLPVLRDVDTVADAWAGAGCCRP